MVTRDPLALGSSWQTPPTHSEEEEVSPPRAISRWHYPLVLHRTGQGERADGVGGSLCPSCFPGGPFPPGGRSLICAQAPAPRALGQRVPPGTVSRQGQGDGVHPPRRVPTPTLPTWAGNHTSSVTSCTRIPTFNPAAEVSFSANTGELGFQLTLRAPGLCQGLSAGWTGPRSLRQDAGRQGPRHTPARTLPSSGSANTLPPPSHLVQKRNKLETL